MELCDSKLGLCMWEVESNRGEKSDLRHMGEVPIYRDLD